MKVDITIEKGRYIAISCTYAIYKTLGKGKTKFVGVTMEKTPCRCSYCLLGGIALGAMNIKVNNEKNCNQAKMVKKIEKEMK